MDWKVIGFVVVVVGAVGVAIYFLTRPSTPAPAALPPSGGAGGFQSGTGSAIGGQVGQLAGSLLGLGIEELTRNNQSNQNNSALGALET